MSLLGYEDPDLKFDILPQPYRKINNIVEDLLKGAYHVESFLTERRV
jgi:hypothetical protein